MITQKTFFNKQDLQDILCGAVLLASGGGGAIKNGQQLIESILKISDQVEYIEPANVDKFKYMPVLAGLGSPDAFEKQGFSRSPQMVFEVLEQVKQRSYPQENQQYRFSYTVPVETGAVAHFTAMLVAVQKGIAVVDGDGGGRAFPSLAMASFAEAINNKTVVPVSPVIIATEQELEAGGTEVELNQNDPAIVDDLGRAIIDTAEFKDVAAIACFAMDGETMQKAIVPNTLTRARKVGRLIRDAVQNQKNPVADVLSYLDGYQLFQGKITDIKKHTQGGFDFGTVVIESATGKKAYILNQNENLVAWSDQEDRPLAIAPDLICYMGTDGQTLSNADISLGQDVTLIGVKAPEQLRKPYFINVFGKALKNLGYYGSYVPIEYLQINTCD